jgi:serine/threonine protein kinase/formylglycine-generating enzyme required for sulfatase activity
MPANTLNDLLDALRQYHLLESKQLDDLTRKVQGNNTEPRTLAQQLIEQGWLTAYQVNQLFQGLGKRLMLGQYVLLDRLGEGGMGEVFKARHTTMGRVVAIKLIHKDRLTDTTAVKRFHREIQAAAQLAHPNVVHAYDADQVDGTHIFVMEYIEGIDLAKLVKEKGPVPIEEACDYIRQAALGLQHAHEKGMVHRDIKPQNLLLAKNGTVKILDMGLARVARPDSDEASTTLTKEGAVMGSLDYIAPEQAMDSHTVDNRADLYSLGCTFYLLLTGKVPFPGGDALAKLMKHKLEEPVPVEKLRPDVPPGLAAIVRKLMAKQPEERYQTPAEVAEALTPFSHALKAASALVACPLPAASAWNTATEAGSRPAAPASTQTFVDAARTRAGRWRKWLAGGVLALVFLVGAILLLVHSSATPVTGQQAAMPPRATSSKSPDQLTLDLGDGVKLELVGIKAGTFLMGSPDSDKDANDGEKPQHEVTISKDFYLGKYPVTQEQYQQIMKENPSAFSANGEEKDQVAFVDTRRFPVENVSWDQAKMFCDKASGLTKRRVELPTQAEWEYACRANTRTRYYCGDELKDTDANFVGKVYLGRTSQVGKYPANPWGLYDMTGNVGQWCADGGRTYTRDKVKDPREPPHRGLGGSYMRAHRGGNWNYGPRDCRSVSCKYEAQSWRHFIVGFRVVVRVD